LVLENQGWRSGHHISNMACELPSMGDRSRCRKLSRLLPLLRYLVISSGCVTQQTSNRSLPLSEARLSLDEARRTKADPSVPYYSIIGDRGRGDTPNSSDGVVPYWSSHLAGAQSELIVPGPHGSYALPQTVAELKRILRLHLAVLGRSGSSAASKKTRSARGLPARGLPTVCQDFASYCSSLRRWGSCTP
jgi:hypothetical protein